MKRYALREIEVSAPLQALELGPEEDGVAVVLRLHDHPVGFALRPLTCGGCLSAADLGEWIGRVAGETILAESVRLELVGDSPPLLPPLPPLTVAVCTRDRPEQLARTLRALHDLTGGDDAPELLVVDNAPGGDRTREVVSALPGVRYVREPLPGLDFARNRALREARGEFVAFVDDDAVVDRGWLDGLREAHFENPDAGGFVGPILPLELSTSAQILFEARGGFGHEFRKRRWGPDSAVDPFHPCNAGRFGSGANMVLRRGLLLSLGGFDEALDTGAPLPGGGDLDAFYRVLAAGHPLVHEPRMLVFHEHREGHTELRRQMWSWGVGLMAYVAKWGRQEGVHRRRFRRLRIWWFRHKLGELLRSLFGRQTRPGPVVLIAAELLGGVQGALGGYARSQRRIARLRMAVR